MSSRKKRATSPRSDTRAKKEEIEETPGALKINQIQDHLSDRTLLGDGQLVPTRLDLSNQSLTTISNLVQFPHLLHLDLSQNALSDISTLSSPVFAELQTLNLSSNKISNPTLSPKPGLQILNLSCNEISNLEPNSFSHPSLTKLLLRTNKLKTLYGLEKSPPSLAFVDLSENQLQNCIGLPPSVISLNLSKNKIDSLEGLSKCCQLTKLDLSQNRIVKFDGVDLTTLVSLIDLDLSSNLISDVNSLRSLSVLPSLRKIRLGGNPILGTQSDAVRQSTVSTKEHDLFEERTRIVSILPTLTHIDDQPVTGAERVGLLSGGHEISAIDQATEAKQRIKRKKKLIEYEIMSQETAQSSDLSFILGEDAGIQLSTVVSATIAEAERRKEEVRKRHERERKETEEQAGEDEGEQES
ncbi:hypothetical protein BLNAU_12984 [Blattamonas nauphoetae]|uniref:L domain-like protein n=1 Tax=Blattamonas nauphoetae TaxID=2049346 RepID=A0ABQ9XI71_9EUKA|nr:hypothetical protein BLNAU_12984 [Blattamonas nauphoetae]